MKRRALLWFGLGLCVAFAQPASKPSFEVASIKPADPSLNNAMWIGMDTSTGLVRYTNITLKDCIRAAYRVRDFQVEGPAWIADARFDIYAKPGEGGLEKIPEMLQALLEERFHLELRRGSKEHAVYALVVAQDGPDLKAGDQKAPEQSVTALGPDGRPRPAMVYSMSPSGLQLQAPAANLATVAEFLSRWMERPVVDLTGLNGQYNLTITFVPEVMAPQSAAMAPEGLKRFTEPGATLAQAVRDFGLRLEARRIPIELLTVVEADRVPTEN